MIKTSNTLSLCNFSVDPVILNADKHKANGHVVYQRSTCIYLVDPVSAFVDIQSDCQVDY